MPKSTYMDPVSTSRELVVYREPLDSPGVVPIHLKRAATLEFPLIEIFHRLLFRLQLGSNLDKVLAVIAVYRAAEPVYRHLKAFMLWAFTSQITIPDNDPVAKEILGWMSGNVIQRVKSTNAMLVTGGLADPNENYYRHVMNRSGQSMQQSDEAQVLPPIGTRFFWVGLRPFLFSRSGGTTARAPGITSAVMDKDGTMQNSIVLRTWGWNLRPLQDFIKSCHDYKIQTKTGTTTVYFSNAGGPDPYGTGWSSVIKAVRKLDTIDMDEAVKADLIRDADYYYSQESRKFFADCGIPYRRGYLFYGPPGTGKTSFSAALAGHLNCDIYMINLATGDISDGRLHRMFLALPRKCVVVIEDIDSAGIGREVTASQPPPLAPNAVQPANLHPGLPAEAVWPAPGPPRIKRNMVTLSGLLNAIDGNASQEGRLLIMTSNNPELLDDALTRPGRIDKKIHFGNMTPQAAHGLFMRLVGRTAVASGAYTIPQIEEYATKFTEKVPADTFTPAQIQNFLQTCRGDPETALRDVEAWVEESMPTKDVEGEGDKEGGDEAPGSVDSQATTMLGEDTDSGGGDSDL